MRALLSTLLCFAFLESQVLAVHQAHFDEGGGPVPDVVGTYSGVMLPDTTSDSSTSATSTSTAASTSTSSIGVFSLNIPSSGIGSGTFIAFSNGRQFNGTIDAVADPDFGALRGVLQATFDFTINRPTGSSNGVTTFTDVSVTATLAGNLTAAITTNLTTSIDATTPSLARIDGTAQLDVNFGGVSSTDLAPIISDSLNFTVVGFKQTSTSTGG